LIIALCWFFVYEKIRRKKYFENKWDFVFIVEITSLFFIAGIKQDFTEKIIILFKNLTENWNFWQNWKYSLVKNFSHKKFGSFSLKSNHESVFVLELPAISWFFFSKFGGKSKFGRKLKCRNIGQNRVLVKNMNLGGKSEFDIKMQKIFRRHVKLHFIIIICSLVFVDFSYKKTRVIILIKTGNNILPITKIRDILSVISLYKNSIKKLAKSRHAKKNPQFPFLKPKNYRRKFIYI